MNSSRLLVSASRAVIFARASDRASWADLYRLLPYLRQTLACAVCGELLRDPYSPGGAGASSSPPVCQHHVCGACRGGRKRLKPACGACRELPAEAYERNPPVSSEVHCYRKLCVYAVGTELYAALAERAPDRLNGAGPGPGTLLDLIREGAESAEPQGLVGPGLTRAEIDALPIAVSDSAACASPLPEPEPAPVPPPPRDSASLSNGAPVYSVLRAGSGNKITIKRKAADDAETSSQGDSSPRDSTSLQAQLSFKKPSFRSRSSTSGKRRGCRCGNATATPGKLTCCGQRCPCYVESKACVECKCKGCRNPHRANGLKVRPVLEVDRLLSGNQESSPSCSGSLDSLDTEPLSLDALDDLGFSEDIKPSDIKVFSNQLQEVSPLLPATIFKDEEPDYSSGGDDDTQSPGIPFLMPSPSHSLGEHAFEVKEERESSDVEVDV